MALHRFFIAHETHTQFQPPFAPFVHPKLPLGPCGRPPWRHGHQLGHCRGARPSRWPFPPSHRGRDGALRRPSARAFLSPAGRQKFRWPITGKRQRGHRSAMSLPMRRSSTPNCHWVFADGHHGATATIGTLPGSAPVPVAVSAVAPWHLCV